MQNKKEIPKSVFFENFFPFVFWYFIISMLNRQLKSQIKFVLLRNV